MAREEGKVLRISKLVVAILCILALAGISVGGGLLGYHRLIPNESAYFLIVFLAGFCGGVVYYCLFLLGEDIVKKCIKKSRATPSLHPSPDNTG